jgi:hypothetical protein
MREGPDGGACLSHPPPRFAHLTGRNCCQPPAALRLVSDAACHKVLPAGALILVTLLQSR